MQWIKFKDQHPKLFENVLITNGEKVIFGYFKLRDEGYILQSHQDI